MRTRWIAMAGAGAAVLLALCSDLAGQAQVEFVGREAPATAGMDESLADLNSRASLPFKARAPARARLRIAAGGRMTSIDVDADEAARRFLTDNSGFFRFDRDWSVAVDRRGEGRRAHLRFRVGDLEVAGASAIVLQAEDGDVVGAAASFPTATAVLGTFRLTASQAQTISRQRVQELRARRGQPDRVEWHPQRTRRLYFATAQGLAPCWQVEERTVLYPDAYVLFLDARNGDLLSVMFLTDHGTGSYPYDTEPGGVIPFATTDGEGKVFKSLGDARKGKATKLTLKNMSKGVAAPALAEKGYVVSAHVDTWDFNGNDAYNTKLKFNYSPYGSGFDFDHFDQVNTLYQIEKFYKHVKKAIGQAPATNFSLPVICNQPSIKPNAYFTTSAFPADAHTNGYIVFLDLALPTLDPAQDLCRDPTIVCHEYTHAWLHFEGLNFTSNLDEPPRAVNEAVADFYAVTCHQDTAIGRYAEDRWPGSGILRDLQDEDHFPETTTASMAISEGGLPEEHMNGEVFGSFLVDFRKRVGNARAEKIVFDTLPYWPHNIGDIGYGSIDAGNCVAATEEFFAQCVAGMLTATLSTGEFGALIGASAARGITNTPDNYYVVSVDLETCAKRKFKIKSRVVRVGAEQLYFFKAQQGRTLAVALVGKNGSGLRPDYTLDSVSGIPGSVVAPQAKKYKYDGRVVKQEEIQLQDTGLATYVITVTGLTSTTGKYTLTLDA